MDNEEQVESQEEGAEELCPAVRGKMPGDAIPGNPDLDEGFCDGGGRDVHQRFTFNPTTGSVDQGQEIRKLSVC